MSFSGELASLKWTVAKALYRSDSDVTSARGKSLQERINTWCLYVLKRLRWEAARTYRTP
jgi:hypothetical protein